MAQLWVSFCLAVGYKPFPRGDTSSVHRDDKTRGSLESLPAHQVSGFDSLPPPWLTGSMEEVT